MDTPLSRSTTSRRTGVPFTSTTLIHTLSFVIGFIALLLLFGCAKQHPQVEMLPTTNDLTHIIDTSLTLEPAQRLAYLRANLGQPERVTEETVPNYLEADQQDVLRTYTHAGVVLVTYLVSAAAEEYLVRLDVQTPQYTAPNDARVGTLLSAVRDELPVLWQDAHVTTYMLPHPDDAPALLTLAHADNEVTLISFEFYLD